MNPNAVYIVPDSPILNPDFVNRFETFSINDSILLKSTLYLTLVENFLVKDSKIDFYFYLDEKDKDSLDDNFKQENLLIKFIDLNDHKMFYEKLSTKEFLDHKNNILIKPDILGITLKDIDKFFNLLNVEDEALLLGKSQEREIGIFGFNNYYTDIFSELIKANYQYDEFLINFKLSSHFIHTTNDILLIRNINNFKQMYLNLSQKVSKEYCSQEMYERFTHLFIEYKDQLK